MYPIKTSSPTTTVGVDWLLYFCVNSLATASAESILRSSNATPRCVRKFLTQPQGGQSFCVKTMTFGYDILFGKGRFAVRCAQYAIHGIRCPLLRLMEVPDLKLAQEAKRHQLNAGDDEDRAEYH